MSVDIIGFVLAIAFGGCVLSFVFSGVRTGRIHHTDSTSTFSFRTQPVRFALVAVVLAGISVMLFYVAILRALAIWRGFAA
jgi:threonine/homoserine efflux transporter RhtA